MSLDVYLTGPTATVSCRCRECNHEYTREEAKEYFSANITHNLNTMADAAGLYQPIWRPEELGITTARELIEPLREGLTRMKADPARFKALNPKNGWGSYDAFIPWIEAYLWACEEHPEARVNVSR